MLVLLGLGGVLRLRSLFGEATCGILESMGFKVERLKVYDEGGVVSGAPGVVEIDMLIRGKEHLLIKINSIIRVRGCACLQGKALRKTC